MLRLAAEQPVHGGVPGRALVAQRVRLVDDDEPVGVLVDRQMPLRVRRAGVELLVRRQLVVGEDLGRQPRRGDRVRPDLLELCGTDDEGEAALLERVLLEEREPDERLAGADAVGVDDAAMPAQDPARALVAVARERRELDACDLAAGRAGDLVAVQLGEGAEVDGARVDESERGEQ